MKERQEKRPFGELTAEISASVRPVFFKLRLSSFWTATPSASPACASGVRFVKCHLSGVCRIPSYP